MSHITKGFEARSTELIIFNIKLAIGFIVLWPGLYYVLHKHVLKTKSPDFARRVLNIVHWLVTCFLSSALYWERFNLKDQSIEYNFEDVAIMNALVYVAFDMHWNFYYKTEAPILLIHHCVYITTASMYIFRDTMRMVFIQGYTLLSCTEPILHIRYFLNHDCRETHHAEYSFIAIFLFIRLGLLTFFGQKYILEDDVDHMDKGLILANYTVGLLFCVNIAQYLHRKSQEACDLGHILRGLGANPHPDTVVAAT